MNALIINCSPVRTGATAEIVKIVAGELKSRYDTRCICIDDYRFAFCRGCRACHKTAQCVMSDAQVIRELCGYTEHYMSGKTSNAANYRYILEETGRFDHEEKL